jgi:hypothetical protein
MRPRSERRLLCGLCAGFRIRSITPGGGLAESPLADKVTRPNILCAAVMVPRETMDVEDARPVMVGHVE